MPVNLQDRPIEQVRQEVIDQLVMNYGHEKISLAAFERRLDKAMESDDHIELQALVADLDLVADQAFVDLKKQELLTDRQFNPDDSLAEAQEEDLLIHIFGSSDRRGVWNVAREVTVVNVFGSGDIDFSEAIFNHREVRVKIFSLFGGSNILVPENINVRTSAFCVFASVKNRAPSLQDSRAPTVVVEGYAVFSGINIKIKRSLKEKIMRFADGVKSILS